MKKIAFIGAGNMARAIITGLISSGVSAQNIMVANPSAEKRLKLAQEFGVLQTDDNNKASEFAEVIVLCVKPHFIAEVCQKISQAINISGKLFISVAAGATVKQIQLALSSSNAVNTPPVVRVMPNTPAQLGLGMSGLFASKEVSIEQKATAEKLMTAVGKIIWLAAEGKINDIIAVAGSAPAYFFLFMEAMEKQALQLGFSAQESRILVQQTALGAAQMVEQSDDAISTLRANVTSKNGTTHAAIEQFKLDGIEAMVKNAMLAAIARAEEMAK
ncbi:pyrroline-5-carboxylate reductase [Colwellia psychrerythraea]|uniref:Pyrroline-5-carboxylate reductase n=2 Tax=Colwellia psychrerythraea TaxID=28229 RepID=A0A099KZS9_COLPS|nr:pyrroline-5-carboxylate reductase [Colwellia psychrerythraea]KGJ96259.1 pyrroline-5-carboxylate reductase [Colwellia psychrerythraea]